MHTLQALVLIAVGCVLAHPSVPADGKAGPVRRGTPVRPPLEIYPKYMLPQVFIPHRFKPRYDPNMSGGLLDKEISLINRLKAYRDHTIEYGPPVHFWMPSLSAYPRTQKIGVNRQMPTIMGAYPIKSDGGVTNGNSKDHVKLTQEAKQHVVSTKVPSAPVPIETKKKSHSPNSGKKIMLKKTTFALTPWDIGFFDEKTKNDYKNLIIRSQGDSKYKGAPVSAALTQERFPPRDTRQNPNLSRTKTLVAENLERLRIGLSQDSDGTAIPHHLHVYETTTEDQEESLFGIALLAAVGAALAMALIAFAIGWYTLSKKVKAAADVEYPAYGVTGPTADASGDRKLAQSAHMYHYQHQKQQIIAMERTGINHRGSLTDPESEEENEEGDYTVYECPGFATTGDMEVKNPLFNDEPTPATPKTEAVKPERKE